MEKIQHDYNLQAPIIFDRNSTILKGAEHEMQIEPCFKLFG